MIKRFILLFTLLIVLITDSKAQDPAASDNACSANVFCSTSRLNGYSNRIQLPDLTKLPYPKPRGFCGEMDGPSWFRFVAQSTTLELRFNYLNCGMGSSGFQTAIFSTTDCKDTAAFSLVSNCISLTAATGTGNLLATNLVSGQTYYLLVDGFSGSQCDYNIAVVQGTIQTVATGNLNAPTAIYGPLDICINATSATFSVPKNANANEYVFSFSTNGDPANVISSKDSFVTFNISPPVFLGNIQANYKNNCTDGPPRNIDLEISDTTRITLPPITLSFGESKSVLDVVYNYGPTPLTTTTTDTFRYKRPGSSAADCDTSYKIGVTRLQRTAATRAYFLKPGESIVLGGTTYSVSATNCNIILASSGDTIYNALMTHTLIPSTLTLNCNSGTLRINKVDSCANVSHNTTYNWYQVNGNGSFSFYSSTNRLTTTTADSFAVVVKDSVIIKGKPESGYKIYYDTLRIRISGVGSADVPPQPFLINGATAVCQGSNNTYTLASYPPKADSLIWTLLRGSGTIISGQGTNNITIKWLGTAARDTLRVVGKNACFTSVPRDLIIDITTFPTFSAGPDASLCGLSTSLSAISGGGTGTWTSAAGNPGVAGFQNSNQVGTTVTVNNAGVYRFVWTETKATCTVADTVAITFAPVPQIVNSSIKDSCNATRNQAFVRFGITGGSTPYNVYYSGTNNIAGTVTNGQFQSVGFTPGSYSFEVKDRLNCSSTLVQGTQACTTCATNAGFMQAATLTICEGDSARAVYLGSSSLEPDDTLQYVLHTGDPRTGIIARNRLPIFGFMNSMTYGTIYYISAIAGNKTATGVDLTDPCFSSSSARQVQVIFNRKPTAVMAVSDSILCRGTCATLNFTLTGRSPFSITAKLSDPTSRDTTWGLVGTSSLTYCPDKNTNFRLFSIRDANNCIDSVNLNKTVNFTIFQPVTAGPDTALTICSGIDTTLILSTLLRGASVGGTWLETSTTASTGGAFNTITNTFRTRNQSARTYRFRYIVNPTAGSKCVPDTAIVTVNLQAIPTVDAGSDGTITCFNPIITIGGNTPISNGVLLQWSSVGGRLSGNAPQQEVSQADIYIITATANGCSARDSVTISVDTTSPRAIIQPIVDTLTCRRDTITLNGTASLPNNNIIFLWLYNGIPYDGNPTTLAAVGGTYELIVSKLSNGCIATDSIRVNENRILPTVFIEPAKKLNCIDTIVTLNSLSSSNGVGYQFQWTSSERGHFIADSTTLEPKVDSSGLYQLRITDNRNGCSDSVSIRVIREVDVPIANAFASDTIDCYHPTINLSARGSTLGVGLVYEWIANPGNIVSGETTINAVVDQPGLYYFIAKNEKTGCAAIDSVQVIRNEARPNAIDFTTKKPTCYGEQNGSINISNVQGGTSPYLFSLDGKVYTQRKSFSNLNAGAYKIYVQDASGCIADSSFNIVQDRQIGVSMGLDTTIKLGDSILLSVGVNTPNVKRVIWSSYSDSLCKKDSSCLQQWVRPVRRTTYSVTVIDTGGCKAVGNITISLDKNRPIFIPNSFSPNNDGVNDIFMIFGSQVVKNIKNFQVFDRWGERMCVFQNFKTDNPAFGWDGKLNGKEVQPGVYPYFVEVEYLDGAVEVIEGDLTLMR
jgi:gliding motility-associated-like protein